MNARAPSTMWSPCWLNSSKKLPSRGSSLPNSIGVSPRVVMTRLTWRRRCHTMVVDLKPAQCSGSLARCGRCQSRSRHRIQHAARSFERGQPGQQQLEIGRASERIEMLGDDGEHGCAFMAAEVLDIGVAQ